VYLYTFFIIGARWKERLTPYPGRFIPGKETGYALYRRRCGSLERSELVWKSTPPEFDPRTVFEAYRCSNLIYILLFSQKGIIGLLQNVCILFQHTFHILCSVEHASLYNLINETKFVHEFFLVYFVNFIYNLYMFRTSPCPSSGGISVFIWHFVFVILFTWQSAMQDGTPHCQPNMITSAKCCINTGVLYFLNHGSVHHSMNQ
jgi:hypothetical protein